MQVQSPTFVTTTVRVFDERGQVASASFGGPMDEAAVIRWARQHGGEAIVRRQSVLGHGSLELNGQPVAGNTVRIIYKVM
jgi:hypothetical protein